MSEITEVSNYDHVHEKPTGSLRWLALPETTTQPPRLQMLIERFQYTRSGDVRWTEYEWRDVPTEVASQ